MALASFVAEHAAEAIRQLSRELNAPELATEAARLAYRPAQLAAAILGAIDRIDNIDHAAQLAHTGLSDLPRFTPHTINRRAEAGNQAALRTLVRSAAAVRLAELMGNARFESRDDLSERQDQLHDRLAEADRHADIPVFRTLAALRAAVVGYVQDAARELPEVVHATPSGEGPTLVLAWQLYRDINRASEIAARNRLPRPGFVPRRPLELRL